MNEPEKRFCYQCKKQIPNVSGKYFCSKECWEEWGKSYKPIKGSKRSIEEIQTKLLEIGKRRSNEKKGSVVQQGKLDDSFEVAREIFEEKS